jgi:pyroglutamyl-peptidase
MRYRFVVVIIGVLFLVVSVGISDVIATKTVLLTGFEPFGVYPTNPSQVIAETLNGSSIADAMIISIVLPVNFTVSVKRAQEAMELYHPDIVMSLGLNAKADGIEVEKLGVNMKRYPLGDGRWSFPRFIDKRSPLIRFTSLPTKEIAQKIQEAGIPALQSYFAGTYICNALFYGLLGYVKEQNLNCSVGFLHVPLLDTQDPQGMPLEHMVDGVKIAIQESLG